MIGLGRVFADDEVVSLYRYRAPYPREVLAILQRLIVEPPVVLDAGCGTGELAREMVLFADRVDAIDPSAAMLAEGRRRTGGDHPRLRWTLGRAEDARLDPPYGLITCGASLHWMSHDVVLPRFRAALASGARLTIVDMENRHPAGSAREDVLEIIKRFSPIDHHRETSDLVEDLVRAGLFTLEGTEQTAPVPFEQSVDDYLQMLGSTSTLSRVTLGEKAASFDAACRDVFARHGVDRVRFDVIGYVAWGRP